MLILREYEIRLIYQDTGLATFYYTSFNTFEPCVPLNHRYIATELTDVLGVANLIDVHQYELSNIDKGKFKIEIWAVDWETNKQGEILDHIQDRLEKTVFSNIKFQLDVTDSKGPKVLAVD
jgi:hypothetical protein